jgi:twitching motility two-component system response regulator PilH
MAIKTVLVVDDIALQLTEIQNIVSEAGYQVITAQSGQEAVDKAKKQIPDLIFMDIVMPEMDGFAATRELKSDSTTKDIPLVFVSSKDQEADKVWAQLQGVEDYVTKPYTPNQIIEKINKFS